MTDQEFREAVELGKYALTNDTKQLQVVKIAQALLHAAALLESERTSRAKTLDSIFSQMQETEAKLEQERKARGEAEACLNEEQNKPHDWANGFVKRITQLKSQVAEYEWALVGWQKWAQSMVDEGMLGDDLVAEYWQAKEALASRGSKVEELVRALEQYQHCRHACSNCFCTKEARQALKAFRGEE
jgi:hypothetical protein